MIFIIIQQVLEGAKPLFEIKNTNPYNLFEKKPNYIQFFKYKNNYIMEGYFFNDENHFLKQLIILDSLSYFKIVQNYSRKQSFLIHYLTSQALISYIFYSDFANVIEIPESFVKPLRVYFPLIWTSFSYILSLKFSPITSSMVYSSTSCAIISYLKNYLVLDIYDRIVWSMIENNFCFITSYYIKPKIPNITRGIFLIFLFYYNYYSFENNLFDIKSSFNSSLINALNLFLSYFERKSTNGDVFFEGFSSFSFGYSFYNLTKNYRYSAIASNLGYLTGFILSQKNDLSLSKSLAIIISTLIFTYTISGTLSNYEKEVYNFLPVILYLDYFLFSKIKI
ncbi:MAG: hypothetical protein ABIL76_00040 [candidate division WOR-3 bacterium]